MIHFLNRISHPLTLKFCGNKPRSSGNHRSGHLFQRGPSVIPWLTCVVTNVCILTGFSLFWNVYSLSNVIFFFLPWSLRVWSGLLGMWGGFNVFMDWFQKLCFGLYKVIQCDSVTVHVFLVNIFLEKIKFCCIFVREPEAETSGVSRPILKESC